MSIPAGHKPLKGSEFSQPRDAKLLGPSDPQERITVRVILSRRTDVSAAADMEARLQMPPMRRERLSVAEHARRYGAAQADLDRVTAFLTAGGLRIEEIHAASRTIVVSGTAAQFGALFSVTLERYQAPMPSPGKGPRRQPATQTYRSFTGSIYVPVELASLIVGVFGLDNRHVTRRNSNSDPPVTNTTTVPQMMQRYDFPTIKATGQTIAIFAVQYGGYVQSDINSYYAAAALSGFTAPTPRDVTDIDGTKNNAQNPDPEVTQDICISSTVAQDATIAVYFNAGDQNGWLGVLKHATFPQSGDPTPSVLSSSFYICDGDDAAGRARAGIPTSFFDALSLAFQDAGVQGLTVCIASGDTGSDSKMDDGRQHVQYPGSDPWVLSCGGTTVGFDNSNNFVEWVWNDTITWPDGSTTNTATGGGVSAYFAKPAYQSAAGVPKSLVDQHVGRGVPDVAANASWYSGYYPMYTSGNSINPWNGNGTSAVAPLYAGLLAVINFALSTNVGFINPVLYTLGNNVCRDVNPAISGGPIDNSIIDLSGNLVAGYPAGGGWDACTGWGSIDGNALLTALNKIFNPPPPESTICNQTAQSITNVIIHNGPPFTVAAWRGVTSQLEQCVRDGYLTQANVNALIREYENWLKTRGGPPRLSPLDCPEPR